MGMRYLGFVVLIWLPGALHAQSAAQPCPPPSLDGGYFVPEQESYDHESEIVFACDKGSKPAVEGWWATSTCQGGTWLPEPQCIDESACYPLEVPNGKYKESQKRWHEQQAKIRITCDKGYELKNRDATAICLNGTWSSVPICEMSDSTCNKPPPQIPHAVIIGQDYQEVFAADSEVHYECENGYTAEGSEDKKIICLSGRWTEGPACSRKTRQDTGHGGRTSTGRTPVGGGERETRPNTGHDGSTAGGTNERRTTEGRGQGTGHGGGTVGGDTTPTGREKQPVGGGSSATSAVTEEDTTPTFVSVDQCGQTPSVANGDVVQERGNYLRYQCFAFYTLVGPEQVRCFNNRSWSELPTCREASCAFKPDLYSRIGIREQGTIYLKEGETKWVSCESWGKHSQFYCTAERRRAYTACCNDHERYYGQCNTYYA